MFYDYFILVTNAIFSDLKIQEILSLDINKNFIYLCLALGRIFIFLIIHIILFYNKIYIRAILFLALSNETYQIILSDNNNKIDREEFSDLKQKILNHRKCIGRW